MHQYWGMSESLTRRNPTSYENSLKHSGSMEEKQTANHVLTFNFHENLPQLRPRSVRLFLASTKADFVDERNCFWNEILPELQQYCLQYGADLVLVDPFQGLTRDPGESREDLLSPHNIQKLLEEVQECRDFSTGVFFVGFIGDKYGSPSLPASLKPDEFNHIRNAAFEFGLDVRLLDEWYKLDNNAIPAVYTLIKPSSKKAFDEKTAKLLSEIVQKSAYQAHKDGLINQVNQKYQERFFHSPLHLLVESATSSKEASQHTLMIMRKFDTHKSGSKKANSLNASNPTYFDSKTEELSGLMSIEKRLADFKNSISSHLDKPNIETFRIICPSGDIETWLSSKDHDKYKDNFSQQLIYKLKQLLGAGFQNNNSPGGSGQLKDPLFCTHAEALTHVNLALNLRAGNYVGNKEILAKIRELCREAERKKGVLITIQGEPCSGRTALLCEVAHLVRNWMSSSDKAVVIPRFIGHCSSSHYAPELWYNICNQICLAYGFQLDPGKTHATKPHECFKECMEKLQDQKAPLILLLDDVHLLKFSSRSSFVPGRTKDPLINLGTLPTNVIVIVTTTDAMASHIGTLLTGKKTNVDAKTTITMPKLSDLELMEIVKTLLSTKKRKITADQEGFLRQQLQKCPSPFMSILLTSQGVHWSSFQFVTNSNSKVSEPSTMSKNLIAAIEQMLVNAERDYGVEIIAALCRYIEGSRSGLTETELLDVLSYNRDVMSMFEEGHDKLSVGPTYVLARFPFSLWIFIKKDLDPLLQSSTIDGRRLFWWSHTIVGTVVRQRYMQNSADIKSCHTDLAEYFGDLMSDSTQTHNHGGMIRRESLLSPMGYADGDAISIHSRVSRAPSAIYSSNFTKAQIFPQPLILPAGDECFFNVRRVKCLWYHLLNAGSLDSLKEESLCNFLYLDAALRTCGLNHIIGIFEETLQQVLHHDLQVFFHQVLVPSLPSICEDNDQLAGEVIGRLRYTRAQNGRFLNGLVEQAMSWVDNYSSFTLLVPLTYWIRPQRRQLALNFNLKFWLKESKTVIQPTMNHQHLLVAGQKEVYNSVTPGSICMYHVSSNTLVRHFSGHTDRVTSLTLSHGGHFFASTSNDKSVRTWDLIQGHCIRNLTPHSDKILCAILTSDDQFIITGSLDSAAKVCNLESGRVVRTYPDHTGPVYALALTCHDEFLVTGSGDFAVRVWHMDDGAPLFSRLGGLMAPVTCMSLTSNDTFLMVACEDETIRVFSLCSGTELHELRGHENKVWSLATAGDDCQVFAGCSDGNIYCYDLHTGEILEVFDCSQPDDDNPRKGKSGSAVTSLKVSDDGWFLFSASGEQIHVWNLERLGAYRHQSGARRLTPIGSDSGIEEDDPDSGREHLTCICMSKDFRYTACGTRTGVVALWDMEVCQCVWTSVHDLPHMVTTVTFNPEATMVFSGVENGNIAVWDMRNGALFRTYSAHEGPVKGIRPLSDGIKILSWDSTDSVHLWPLWSPEDADLDLLTTFKGPSCFIEVSSNDHDVLGRNAENAKEIGMWGIIEEGLQLRTKMGHNGDITCLVLSRNGRILVTGSVDYSLKVWDGENGFLTQVLVGHEGPVICCAVADDEKTVVSAAEDRLVIVWEIENGTAVHLLNAHLNFQRSSISCKITAVGVSSDAVLALSADNTGWLYAWSCETGELLTAFDTHLPILQMEMAADASRIALRLERCPHLPIICLHNTPAGPLMVTQLPSTSGRRRSRAHSITSTGSSNISASSGSPAAPTMVSHQQSSHQPSGHAGVKASSSGVSPSHAPASGADPISGTKASTRLHPRAPSKVFDKLERSRSRASMYGEMPTATLTRLATDKGRRPRAVEANSTLCVLL